MLNRITELYGDVRAFWLGWVAGLAWVWARSVIRATHRGDVGAAQQAVRIEIDCTLLPCSVGLHACLIQVPARIQALGIPNKPLRIFSHRNELAVRDYSDKRYFDCNSSNTPAQLATALTNSDW